MSAAVANPAGLARAGETRLKLPKMQRSILMEAPIVDSEQRSITFPFSSTYPVERWFGQEVLSHESGAADLSRLNDGAPLLYNHDPNQLIGVVERAWIDGGRGYVTARFSQNDLAQQVMGDVADNVLRNVSFGYRVMNMVSDGSEGDSATFTATRWAPYEISLVTIPADPTVGIGREEPTSDNEVTVSTPEPVEPAQPASTPTPESRDLTMENTSVNFDEVRSEAVAAERARIASISKLGEKFNQADMARQLIEGGKSLDDARSAFLEKLGAKQEPIADKGTGTVDMSERDMSQYSVVKAIRAAASGKWNNAGLEREVSAELARQSGRETEGFFMPLNLRAPYAVGASATGGSLVATNLLAGSFIEVLRAKAMIMQMGVTTLTGLVGNIAIPRQTSATQTYWVNEAASLTEAEVSFDQVTMSPKQVGALSQYSRLMLQQSTPDIEMVVRNDLAKVMALAIDKAAINGAGSSGEPTGILNTSGIGTVSMGTNGAAFANGSASVTPSGLDQLIQLESKLDIANALEGSLYYMTNAKVIAQLKQLKDQYGGYLWSNNTDATTSLATPGSISGYSVARTNQVPFNLSKGTGTNLSALLFGNFSDLVIGMWGALEILPNPYGSGYNSGSINIRSLQTVDIAVRHAASFAAITDIAA